MGAGRHEAFLTRRGLQHFVPRSPQDRGGQVKSSSGSSSVTSILVVLSIFYPLLSHYRQEIGSVNLCEKLTIFDGSCCGRKNPGFSVREVGAEHSAIPGCIKASVLTLVIEYPPDRSCQLLLPKGLHEEFSDPCRLCLFRL